jgi:hypothetical protein
MGQSLAKGAAIKPNVSADQATSSLQYSLEQLVAADKELHRVRTRGGQTGITYRVLQVLQKRDEV